LRAASATDEPGEDDTSGGDMQAVLGSECNVWLVVGLLMLVLGLAAALLAATRDDRYRTRRTR
jgi:type IV secretory pathway TrbD component